MKLYDYQQKIFEQAKSVLSEHGLVYLALEMRLGKTPIALHLTEWVYSQIDEKGSNLRSLCITKKKAIDGIKETLNGQTERSSGVLEIINYESLHKIENSDYSVIIIDEAHTLGSYPKVTKTQRAVNQIVRDNPQAKIILLSGTPNIESGSQLFHQFRITDKVFSEYTNFYKWFKVFGVPNQLMVRGRLINDYSEVKQDELNSYLAPYFVSATQSDAGFSVSSQIHKVELVNDSVVEFEREFLRENFFQSGDLLVTADGSASALSKILQVCGGTVIDESESSVILPQTFSPYTKIEAIKRLEKQYSKIAVFTNFIGERDYVALNLENRTDDIEAFKNNGDIKYFIGSGESYSEGVDLSKVDDCCIVVYSMSWKGKVLTQLAERQNNKLRKEPINIYCLIIKDTAEENLFQRVAIEKQNFNNSFFQSVR